MTVDINSTMHMRVKDGDAEPATVPYADDAVWRYPASAGRRQADEPTLYNTQDDPRQTENRADELPGEVARLRGYLEEALDTVDAPAEQYDRLGLK